MNTAELTAAVLALSSEERAALALTLIESLHSVGVPASERAVARTVVVYVDVDDTLIRSFGSKHFANGLVVERVRTLCAEAGVLAYCWSSGGADYAERIARELEIHHLFAGFLPKPNVMIDDQRPEAWRDLLILHPNEAAHAEAASLRAALRWVDPSG